MKTPRENMGPCDEGLLQPTMKEAKAAAKKMAELKTGKKSTKKAPAKKES